MRLLARIAIPLALGLAPLAATTPASAEPVEIIDWCYYHDIEARVTNLVCIGVNYPS